MRGILTSTGGRVAGAVVCATLAVALAVAALVPTAGGAQRSHRRARTARVNISRFAFHPGALKVKRGTKVIFTNSDSVAHTATTHTATRRKSFNTGHIRPGHSVAVRFKHPGVYRYQCLIHPFMHGKIVVR